MSELTKALDEFFGLLEEMGEDRFGMVDDIVFSHELCINAAAELDQLRAQLAEANEYGDHWQEIAQAETKKLEAAQARVELLRHGMERAEQTIRNMGMAFPAGDDYHEIALNEIHNIYNDLDSTAWLAEVTK